MSQSRGFEAGSLVDKFREHIFGMLVGVAAQGGERFQFANRLEPLTERSSVPPAPALRGKDKLQPVEDDKVENANKYIVRRLQIFHSAIQPGDGLRRQNASLLQPGLQLHQPGARERFALKCG